MLIFTRYLNEMKEDEAIKRIDSFNISSLYKIVLFSANVRTYQEFLELNTEFNQDENIEFFLEKQRFMGEELISISQLKRTFNELVGREIFQCELDYFANCSSNLKPLH